MHGGAAFLQDLRSLIADEGFALSMLAVVGVATVLAFGFGATPEIVAPVLVLGVVTAFAERKLRAKK
jgi:hypothetical protein